MSRNKEVSATKWIRVGSKEEIRPKSTKVVSLDKETKVCIVRVEDGAFFALEDRCSHEDENISGGGISGREITCPHHFSRFDLATGRPLSLPAVVPIPTYPVKLEGNDLFIGVVLEEEEE